MIATRQTTTTIAAVRSMSNLSTSTSRHLTKRTLSFMSMGIVHKENVPQQIQTRQYHIVNYYYTHHNSNTGNKNINDINNNNNINNNSSIPLLWSRSYASRDGSGKTTLPDKFDVISEEGERLGGFNKHNLFKLMKENEGDLHFKLVSEDPPLVKLFRKFLYIQKSSCKNECMLCICNLNMKDIQCMYDLPIFMYVHIY